MKRIFLNCLVCIAFLLGLAGSAQAGAVISPPVPPFGWTIERVDAPRLYTDLTSTMFQMYEGYPYIAFGGDHLYYASLQSAGWQFEVVDPAWGAGRFASLALLPDGRALISYYNETTRALMLAEQITTSTPHTWSVRMVDSLVDGCTSLDLDSNNQPAIAYQKNEHLYYIRRTCTGLSCSWSFPQAVDTSGQTGDDCHLVMDSLNRPHIAYSDETKDDLKYAVHNGTEWILSIVDSTYKSGLSLAVDSSRRPHISYSGASYKLYYAWLNRGAWEITNVDDTSTLTTSLVLFENAYDKPHIAYNSTNGPKYAYLDEMNPTCTGDGWACEVTNGNDMPFWLSLQVLDDGAGASGRLVYYDMDTAEIHYSKDTGGAIWSVYDFYYPSGNRGQGVSLTFDNYDPVISYHDSATNYVRYAKRDASKGGPTCGADYNGWTCTGVTNHTDKNTSLQLDYYYKNPSILYENTVDGHGLELIRYNGTSWEIPELISTSNIGALDHRVECHFEGPDYKCIVHVAYMDTSTFSVMYARSVENTGNCGGGKWQCETVDNNLGWQNGGINLTLENSGKPAISYYDGLDKQIRVAYRKGDLTGTGCGTGNGDWECDLVETVGDIDPATALAFTEEDNAIVAYFSATAGAVKYAYTTTPHGAFTSQEIYPVSSNKDLELVERLGLIVLAFYDDDEDNLVLARLVYDNQGNCGVNGNFQCDIIDAAGDVGSDLALGLSKDNRIYIAYYDATNGDLKLASQGIPVFLPVISR